MKLKSVKLKSAADITAISVGLIGIIFFSTGLILTVPSGEQSKMMYEGNLWCVSNFIEQEPQELLADGRPRRDRRLDTRESWIRRQQVSAQSAEEAMSKATISGFFEESDKARLRQALDENDQNFFIHHFNEGATVAGPCLGSGELNQQVGKWINDALREENPPQLQGNLPSAGPAAGKDYQPEVARLLHPPAPPPATAAQAVQGGQITGLCPSVPTQYAQIFSAAGQKFRVQPAWLAAIFAAENGVAYGSKNNPKLSRNWPNINGPWSTSSASAQGPMQFIPSTWQNHKQDGNNDGKKDIQNIWDAVFAAAHYIQNTAGNFTSDPKKLRDSAVAYNAGGAWINKSDDQLPAETQAYIARVALAFKNYYCPNQTAPVVAETTNQKYAFPISPFKESYKTLKRHHDGKTDRIDFATGGTPTAVAITSGTVSRWVNKKCGNGLTLKGDDGITYTYCHFAPNSYRVSDNQRVKVGQPLGTIDNTGRSTGNHLHLTAAGVDMIAFMKKLINDLGL